MPESGQSYLDQLCNALAEVLSNAYKGTKDRLAGYAANFEFWVKEAEHRIVLIKDYEERFKRFHGAQKAIAAEGPVKWNERGGWTPPPDEVKRSTSANDRNQLQKLVIKTFTDFADRCFREDLIDDQTRSDAIRRIHS